MNNLFGWFSKEGTDKNRTVNSSEQRPSAGPVKKVPGSEGFGSPKFERNEVKNKETKSVTMEILTETKFVMPKITNKREFTRKQGQKED